MLEDTYNSLKKKREDYMKLVAEINKIKAFLKESTKTLTSNANALDQLYT